MDEQEKQIEVLHTAYEYLGQLIEGTIKATEYLHAGKEYKGFQFISLIADGIMWLIEVIEKTYEVQKEEIKTTDVIIKINEINEAMKINDTVLIADLLEFEVVPILRQWRLSVGKSIAIG